MVTTCQVSAEVMCITRTIQLLAIRLCKLVCGIAQAPIEHFLSCTGASVKSVQQFFDEHEHVACKLNQDHAFQAFESESLRTK